MCYHIYRGKIFGELSQLYPKVACKEFLLNLPLLEKRCGYRYDNYQFIQSHENKKTHTHFTWPCP